MAIAETIGALMEPGTSDPEAVFVNAMNAKAQELGCTDTVYDNPHGLDSTPTRAICTARRPTWRKWCSTPDQRHVSRGCGRREHHHPVMRRRREGRHLP
ncbi:MAG: hypothetical protein ACLSVD_08010 [Eggerthellaceae bacterium]